MKKTEEFTTKITDEQVMEIANRPAQERALRLAEQELKTPCRMKDFSEKSQRKRIGTCTELDFILDSLMFGCILLLPFIVRILIG